MEATKTASGAKAPDYSWAILELLGHRTIAGRVYEVQRFGTVLGAIDVPDTSPTATPDTFRHTRLFQGGSIYCLTYCTEEAARAAAAQQAKWEHPPTHYQALPARPADHAPEADALDPPVPCEDCGCDVELDLSSVGPVLCLACTEDRDRERDEDLREQGLADDAEADAAAGIEAAVDAGAVTNTDGEVETTPW